MRMVFNNLIINALRYSSIDSSLVIHVRQDDKFCNIDFVDQGFGFDKKELKRVFKKFYRVQNQETQIQTMNHSASRLQNDAPFLL